MKAILVLLAVSAALLSGCGASTDPDPTPNPAASQPPPVFLDEDRTSVTVDVGDVMAVTTPGVTEIITTDPAVLQVDQDVFEARAIATGNAQLQVFENEDLLYTVTVSVR